MQKALFFIGLPLLALGILRFAAPQVLFRFAGLDPAFAILAMAVGGSVLLLTSPLWQHIDFRPLFAVAAAGCISLAMICLNTPTLWGLRSTYLSLMDVFVSLEGGVMLGLAALEKKADALSIVTSLMITAQLLHSRRRTRTALRPLHQPHYNA